jgi:hypothetical protein
MSWLNPFPVVRLKGVARRGVTVVQMFSVSGPRGALTRVKCGGRSCPRKAVSVKLPSRRAKRFGQFERRLRSGVRLEVSVTRSRAIGKYTRLVMRNMKPPRRIDRCMVPGTIFPVRCPAR